MKKIILTSLVTLAISTITLTNFASANGEGHNDNEMKMQIMQMQNNFMERLKKEVDSETAKKLDEMIVKHRSEMKKMMEMAEKMHPTEEQKKQKRMEMKKRHFEDLKNVLKNYPKVYEKYSAEMEEIMAKIMKMRQSMKHNENAKSIREWGRTVWAGQFMKHNEKGNEPNNKADLKQLAEQLVNLSIKYRDAKTNEEKTKILSKIIIIVEELKKRHKDKLIINFWGKRKVDFANNNWNIAIKNEWVKEKKIKVEWTQRMWNNNMNNMQKADTKKALDAFQDAITKKWDLILNKIEKKLSRLSESKKQYFYKKIVKKLNEIKWKIKSEQKRNLVKYILIKLEQKIAIWDPGCKQWTKKPSCN